MRILPGLTITALVLAPGVTFAADKLDNDDVYDPGSFYLGARVGGIDPLKAMHEMDTDTYEFSFDERFYGGLYAGIPLGHGLRGEIGIDFLHFDFVDGREDSGNDPGDFTTVSGGTDAIALTASLWKDLPQVGPATPYVGLGAGLAWTSMDVTLNAQNQVSEGDDVSAVGLVGAGLQFDLGHRTKLDVGYRFQTIMNARGEQVSDPANSLQYNYGHYTNHTAFVGVSRWFGDYGMTEAPSGSSLPWYVGGYVGQTWTPDMHIARDHGEQQYSLFADPQNSYGAVLGAEIAPGLRGELEIGRILSDAEQSASGTDYVSGLFEQTFALVNVWQDLGSARLRPYVGGGLGYAHLDYDFARATDVYNSTAHVFAGQFGTGLRFDVTSALTLDIGYRMKSAIGAVIVDDVDDGGTFENRRATFNTHNVQIGGTYTFGADGPMPEYTHHDAYLSLGIGTGFDMVGELLEDESTPFYFDRPFTANLAYGHYITPKLRGEIELIYTQASGDRTQDDNPDDPYTPVNGGFKQFSAFNNYWADFDLGPLKPYLGGGIGMSLIQPKFDAVADAERYYDGYNPALALQAGLGLRKDISDRFAIDIGYRFRAAIDAFARNANSFFQAGTVTYETHAVQTNLVWKTGK